MKNTSTKIDLRDVPCMPLDVSRLLNSDTWLAAADDPILGFALMTFWMRAWHQVPAGSLPADDSILARLAMCDKETWARIKSAVLAGWNLTDDGRYHHAAIAEKAAECDEQRTKKAAFAAVQRAKGLASAAARAAGKTKMKPAKSLPAKMKSDESLAPSAATACMPLSHPDSIAAVPKKNDDAKDVFNHWVAVFKKSGRTVFDAARQKKINARLKEGYSVAELKLAIDGCSMRSHNQGGTNGTVYNQIDLIFRDADHVEKYISTARGQKDLFVSASSDLSQAAQQSMSALESVFGSSAPGYLKEIGHD